MPLEPRNVAPVLVRGCDVTKAGVSNQFFKSRLIRRQARVPHVFCGALRLSPVLTPSQAYLRQAQASSAWDCLFGEGGNGMRTLVQRQDVGTKLCQDQGSRGCSLSLLCFLPCPWHPLLRLASDALHEMELGGGCNMILPTDASRIWSKFHPYRLTFSRLY